MKRLLAALLAMLVLAATAGAATTPHPARYALRAAQVGKGFFPVIVGGGSTLKKPTLDICHEKLPSEKLRLARFTIGFVHTQTDPAISNEIVIYKPGGAAQAMREVARAVLACPKGPVTVGAVSVTSKIAPLHPKGSFLPGALAYGYHQYGTVSGHTVSQYALVIYQRRGDVLSSVVAHDSTLAKRLLFGGHAAAQSARNLRTRG
jgi:hypothetical protein